ncbi:MAG: YggS family pyridoxal phosphate-dependent enzyme [Desulfovibrio sp.]|jgi:pyridoxal phosphate enzyme (YggS family)|nr:YggS family pyridoxal phosphate-dependent enzyme [Desulfovibrio sp.]
MSVLTQRFDAVCERITRAAERSGRSAGAVRLVAISKLQGADRVAELASYWEKFAKPAGIPVFGENYVQEAMAKKAEVTAKLPELSLEWHFTGHIQSRKSRDVVGAFALLHAVDSLGVAQALEKAWQNRLRESPAGWREPPPCPQAVLAQVNIGRERQKSGIDPDRLEELIVGLAGMSALRAQGLMCIPPQTESLEASRPYFALLRQLRDSVSKACGVPLPHLSMGMSGDFEAAIEEGATLVRIGTAIFGARL